MATPMFDGWAQGWEVQDNLPINQINSGKNAVFFCICFENLPLGILVRTHTFHWCVSAMNNKMH